MLGVNETTSVGMQGGRKLFECLKVKKLKQFNLSYFSLVSREKTHTLDFSSIHSIE